METKIFNLIKTHKFNELEEILLYFIDEYKIVLPSISITSNLIFFFSNIFFKI